MPDYHVFKCNVCGAVAWGPEVAPNSPNSAQVGAVFEGKGSLAMLVCAGNAWHKKFVYTGRAFRPPQAPALPSAAVGPTLSKKWILAEDGSYSSELKYPNIPAAAQVNLKDVLGPLLAGKPGISLLGASYDRFDSYGDVEDVAIRSGGTAEKILTLPLVLDRLNKVAAELASTDLWKQATIDRQLGGASASLMLPAGVDGYRFHLELLNDLVNPRGGHSVAADTYAQAIKKAIALSKANHAGESSRDASRGYYFYSTRSNRGLNVVVRSSLFVLTVYYSSAATAWWTGNLAQALRTERTVA